METFAAVSLIIAIFGSLVMHSLEKRKETENK